jgi:tRNA (guanine37-N1)-methyltransferase
MISFKVFTIFPEMFPGALAHSITGRALENNLWKLSAINIRDYAKDKRKTIDDAPYGGGAGMVLKPDVLASAIEENISDISSAKIFCLSPRGKLFTQKKAIELSGESEVSLICGRYEGVDQRVIDEFKIEEISIGNYIVSGGEIPAFVMIDAILRNVDGVIDDESLAEESFSLFGSDSLLEYPHYTKPRDWRGRFVPDVLVSGNHKKINEWRLQKAEEITKESIKNARNS